MAARLNRRHQDMVRDKIRASQIINRLENHVFSIPEIGNELNKFIDSYEDELDPDFVSNLRGFLGAMSHRMEQTQVNAALGLLKKCVPDLRAADLNVDFDPDRPLSLKVTFPDGRTTE